MFTVEICCDDKRRKEVLRNIEELLIDDYGFVKDMDSFYEDDCGVSFDYTTFTETVTLCLDCAITVEFSSCDDARQESLIHSLKRLLIDYGFIEGMSTVNECHNEAVKIVVYYDL